MASGTPLEAIVAAEIRAQGRISFARFMELCLYEPRYGYYNQPGRQLGKAGDFYTSAHAGPLFARLLARHLAALWKELGCPARFDLVELGPGDGQLAAELLGWLARRHPDLSSCFYYTGVEQSGEFRSRLEVLLRQFGSRARVLPGLLAGSKPGDADAASPTCGCVFANEFFDALPFHILRRQEGQWQECTVAQNATGELIWQQEPAGSLALVEQAESFFGPATPGEEEEWVAEIAPAASEWMARIGNWLGRGEVLIVDYGYTRDELRAGRFPEGSALAYRQHHATGALLAHPGQQDLTAHVNFSQLIAAGLQCGLRFDRLVSQEKFLMEIGEADQFAELFTDCATEHESQQRRRLLKNLLLPQEMGGAFRVLEMTKG